MGEKKYDPIKELNRNLGTSYKNEDEFLSELYDANEDADLEFFQECMPLKNDLR